MISNSTPIIHLSKINNLNLLKKLFKKIIIPIEVKNEILLPDEEEYFKIQKAIDEGWIIIEKTTNPNDYGLGAGESAAICLAKEKKDSLIIDDNSAIKIARSLDINYYRTTTIILLACQKNILSKPKAKDLIHELVETGYYLSPTWFSKMLRLIDSL